MCKCQGNHILLLFKPRFVDLFFLQIAPKIDLYNHSQHSILKFKGLEVFQSFPESVSSSDMRVYLMPPQWEVQTTTPDIAFREMGEEQVGHEAHCHKLPSSYKIHSDHGFCTRKKSENGSHSVTSDSL